MAGPGTNTLHALKNASVEEASLPLRGIPNQEHARGGVNFDLRTQDLFKLSSPEFLRKYWEVTSCQPYNPDNRTRLAELALADGCPELSKRIHTLQKSYDVYQVVVPREEMLKGRIDHSKSSDALMMDNGGLIVWGTTTAARIYEHTGKDRYRYAGELRNYNLVQKVGQIEDGTLITCDRSTVRTWQGPNHSSPFTSLASLDFSEIPLSNRRKASQLMNQWFQNSAMMVGSTLMLLTQNEYGNQALHFVELEGKSGELRAESTVLKVKVGGRILGVTPSGWIALEGAQREVFYFQRESGKLDLVSTFVVHEGYKHLMADGSVFVGDASRVNWVDQYGKVHLDQTMTFRGDRHASALWLRDGRIVIYNPYAAQLEVGCILYSRFVPLQKNDLGKDLRYGANAITDIVELLDGRILMIVNDWSSSGRESRIHSLIPDGRGGFEFASTTLIGRSTIRNIEAMPDGRMLVVSDDEIGVLG